ncbi:pyridoxal-phosphate dependent enzyme [Acidiphilium sp. AL]|uniref:pyridoxal-phosphate dependent enzyme n=1 Tax=Acidiphilium sp. AL TaxID=2871704 RepID=UPI0021CAEABE|nr:pyridoxal-phosphate dependent enzyme [Acidiphilium sp. AL]MCU4159569.1 pyridoxal-phosphate dependent enzyme [Acidiphilium sp. AL]
MNIDFLSPQNADDIAAELLRLSPDYAATPLHDLPALAARLGVAQLLAKDEGRRRLGSFKSLGGTYAGLRALARAAGRDVAGLLDPGNRPAGLPALVCASDGNHGLAVASAARFAGAKARIFLHGGVPALRARRIEAQGAEIVWIAGTYDDAVDAAAEAARRGDNILVADVAGDLTDPVVNDVMAGYGVIAAELRRQVGAAGHRRPTHLFVQAGVGGLAAALADGLRDWLAAPAGVIVVEPEQAPCVAAALAAGHIVQVPGRLETSAEMLSCGTASAPALEVLRKHGARVVTVSEDALAEAPRLLRDHGGPATTPSGAAGLAGVAARALDLAPDSRVMVIVTEAELDMDC